MTSIVSAGTTTLFTRSPCEGEHGTGELVLDLDFIVEWLKPNPTLFRYLIAPATLTFRRVCDLNLSVDYASCGMGPFSIDGIERQAKVYPNGYSTFSWRIPINYPRGEVTFIADGFMQVLRSEPRELDRMMLS